MAGRTDKPRNTQTEPKGAYPGADPTAPGGMSQKALVAELVDKHQFTKAAATGLTWPEQIDAVCKARLAAEYLTRCDLHGLIHCAECSGAAAEFDNSLSDFDRIMAEHEGEPVGAVEEALADAGLDPDDLDPDQMVADLAAARAAHEAEQAALPPDQQPRPMFLGMPDTKDFIFDGHMGAGPSGAERWMHCTASLGAARSFLETLSPNQQAQFAPLR